MVGFARRNFMTPRPRFASWDAFNAYLEEQCRNRQGDILRGHRESIGERSFALTAHDFKKIIGELSRAVGLG